MSNRREFRNQEFVADRFTARELPVGTIEDFGTRNTASALVGYGNPVGTTNVANICDTGRNHFEIANIGTQTILAPVFSADGYNIAFDQTNGDGVEMTRGITAKSPSAAVVGQDRYYFEATFKLADVSGIGNLALGYRKAEAYQLNIDDYDELCALNINGATINRDTILNGGATTTTDTGETVADNDVVTLRVELYPTGEVVCKVDGVEVLATSRFSFDDGEVVVPFVYFTNGADLADTLHIQKWVDGYLDLSTPV